MTTNKDRVAPSCADPRLISPKLRCFQVGNVTASHPSSRGNIGWSIRDSANFQVVSIPDRQLFTVAPYGLVDKVAHQQHIRRQTQLHKPSKSYPHRSVERITQTANQMLTFCLCP